MIRGRFSVVPRRIACGVVLFVGMTLFGAAAARGQTGSSSPVRRWEIEPSAGGVFGGALAGGVGGAALPVGSSIPVVFGGPTRAVSSWYFGDGAALLNDAFAASPPAFGWTARISPLDPILKTLAVGRGRWSGGFNVLRQLSPRFAVDLGIEVSPTGLALLPAAASLLAATRDSYQDVWSQFTSGAGFKNVTVTSTSALSGGRRTAVNGSLQISLKGVRHTTPHLTIGVGRIETSPLVIRLVGHNAFTFDATPYAEVDMVRVTISEVGRRFVGLVGGGVRHALSSRHGIRLDVNVALRRPRYDTRLSAAPEVATISPAGVIVTGRTPNLQFSNNPSTGRQSNLSGSPIDDLETFGGAKAQVHGTLRLGMYFRF